MSSEPIKINRPVFVKGADGQPVAVILDMDSFNTLIELLEDENDNRWAQSNEAKERMQEPAIPFDQAVAEIEAIAVPDENIPDNAETMLSLDQAKFMLEILCYPGAEKLEDDEFWHRASRRLLDEIWDNPDDDVYGGLLK